MMIGNDISHILLNACNYSIDSIGVGKDTSLDICARFNNTSVLKVILDNVTSSYEMKQRALSIAASHGSTEVACLLVGGLIDYKL